MLNHGARRLRASKIAGKATIPAIIDETHTDYDQIIENLQRDDLKPMELADFIGRKLKSGDKKAFIARQLGIDASIITQHLALIDLPDCIHTVYGSGRCQSPKTLYDLRMLFEAYPDEVNAWCATGTEITRRSVAEFGERLKATMSATNEANNGRVVSRRRGIEPDRNRAVGEAFPQIWVDFKGRPALLVLERLPDDPTEVFLRFEGSPTEQAARAGDCRLIWLRME